MTKQELDKFTPEEKRIKIAEACGWRFISSNTGSLRIIPPDGTPPQYGDSGPFYPEYLSDLNAMHEAAKMLSRKDNGAPNFRSPYEAYLQALDYEPCATAAQRADAFLLTAG